MKKEKKCKKDEVECDCEWCEFQKKMVETALVGYLQMEELKQWIKRFEALNNNESKRLKVKKKIDSL